MYLKVAASQPTINYTQSFPLVLLKKGSRLINSLTSDLWPSPTLLLLSCPSASSSRRSTAWSGRGRAPAAGSAAWPWRTRCRPRGSAPTTTQRCCAACRTWPTTAAPPADLTSWKRRTSDSFSQNVFYYRDHSFYYFCSHEGFRRRLTNPSLSTRFSRVTQPLRHI